MGIEKNQNKIGESRNAHAPENRPMGTPIPTTPARFWRPDIANTTPLHTMVQKINILNTPTGRTKKPGIKRPITEQPFIIASLLISSEELFFLSVR